jgi:predicted lipid-binding transport protein (Tim44 family)
MRHSARIAAGLCGMLVLAPALGLAAAGDGNAFGSRGTHSYTAPPATGTAPRGAAPLERSMAPRAAPSYATSDTVPRYARAHGQSSFMSGLLGGLIGAGLGALLLGHGLFWGIHGLAGFLGLLLQVFLIVWFVRWLLRRRPGRAALAGGGLAGGGYAAPPAGPAFAGAPAARSVTIGPADYQVFEQRLHEVQAAWSAHDLNRLRAIATPEMVGYFAEQLAEQASRGLRNEVFDVQLQQGDLAEAWAEGEREYATVAMRFSMRDTTRDASGEVVDGSLAERVTTTEIWTFLRASGGRWILAAIQQAR